MKRAPTPYDLATVGPRIAARGGPEHALLALSRYPGATLHAGVVPWVDLPMERAAFMAAEAVAVAATSSPGYIAARNVIMSPDPTTLPLVEWLKSAAGPPLARSLKEHQEHFLRFAVHKRGVINASEQGLGKTTTALAAAHMWGSQRVLVLCNKSLVPEWVTEFSICLTGATPYQIVPLGSGSARSRSLAIHSLRSQSQPTILAVNYDVLDTLKHDIEAYDPDFLILDEAWKVKSPRSKRFLAAVNIADRTARVMPMTGTPIGNSAADLWALLRLCDSVFSYGRRTHLQAYEEFWHRYLETDEIRGAPGPQGGGATILDRRPGAIRDPAGLMRALEPYWFRATKSACLSLFPKRYIRVPLKLIPELKELDEALQRDGEAALGAEGSLGDARVIQLRRCQLAGGAIPVPTPLVDRQPVVDAGWRDAAEMDVAWEDEPFNMPGAWIWTSRYPKELCEKSLWLRRFSEDVLSGDRSARALVWCRFTAEVDRALTILRKAGVKAESADGRTKDTALAAMKASWKSRDPEGVQVLVCQWEKMAYGHNLQEGDYHIKWGHTWSFVQRMQAEDRSDRMGRDGAVTYYDLVCTDSVDVDVLEATDRKEDFAARGAPSTVPPKSTTPS